MKYSPGFEEQLQQRNNLDFYALKKAEAQTLTSNITSGISANITRQQAVALRRAAVDWLDSLEQFAIAELEPNEARDVRFLKMDVSDARAKIVEYIQSLPQ